MTKNNLNISIIKKLKLFKLFHKLFSAINVLSFINSPFLIKSFLNFFIAICSCYNQSVSIDLKLLNLIKIQDNMRDSLIDEI